MNAKEFDDMKADLKYRKHLKYSQADMDEKLREQREACENKFIVTLSLSGWLRGIPSQVVEKTKQAILDAEADND
jgi:tRNA A-37 threonylcarbamoyl transferase component Bud32